MPAPVASPVVSVSRQTSGTSGPGWPGRPALRSRSIGSSIGAGSIRTWPPPGPSIQRPPSASARRIARSLAERARPADVASPGERVAASGSRSRSAWRAARRRSRRRSRSPESAISDRCDRRPASERPRVPSTRRASARASIPGSSRGPVQRRAAALAGAASDQFGGPGDQLIRPARTGARPARPRRARSRTGRSWAPRGEASGPG